MTLQALTPEWLASPEGKLWKKKMRKRHDKIIVDAFNEIEFNEIEFKETEDES